MVTSADSDAVDRMSGIAAAVWRALDVPRTIAEVAALTASSSRADARPVTGELQRLLDELVRRRWVELVNG